MNADREPQPGEVVREVEDGVAHASVRGPDGKEIERYRAKGTMQRGRVTDTGRQRMDGTPIMQWRWRDCTEDWARTPQWIRLGVVQALRLRTQL